MYILGKTRFKNFYKRPSSSMVSSNISSVKAPPPLPGGKRDPNEVEPSPSAHSSADARYSFDVNAMNAFKTEAPWMKNPKYFKKVAISPSAVMKIMMHCESGVQKGIEKGGNPVEVMGMLLGRPEQPSALVVTDAFPLPIEGFETRVIADDENVVNHMIQLGEALEITRKERFMGWYHSHPFDLAQHSHCFLSQTDLSTQLQWQRAEDPHGNPFVAIVVDPLRSAHQTSPELKAFRVYPPEYNPPLPNECPDGSIETNEQQRLELWGSCWNRYYELNVEYFMSSCSRRVLGSLTQDYLWIRTLANQPESKLTEKLVHVAKEFEAIPSASPTSFSKDTASIQSLSSPPSTTATIATPSSSSSSVSRLAAANARSRKCHQAVHKLTDLAAEELAETTLSNTKKHIFS